MCLNKLHCVIAVCLVVVEIRWSFSTIRISSVVTETEEYLRSIDLNIERASQLRWESHIVRYSLKNLPRSAAHSPR
jgi:hypothetical protein